MSLPSFDHSSRTGFTESPNPTWSHAQTVDSTAAGRAWLEGEKQGWKVIDTANQDSAVLYRLMISGIVPRPIAFVSSISDGGVENLAPFSCFTMVNSTPPMVVFNCVNDPEGIKDTARNVKNGNGFTVNIISEPFAENAHVTAIDSPSYFEEWSISGLTKAPSVHVKASRVRESAFSLECSLYQAIDIANPNTGRSECTLVLGSIKYIHVRNDVLNERGVIDIAKYKPISRLGDISYGRVGDAFRLPRTFWAVEESKLPQELTDATTEFERIGSRLENGHIV